MGRGPLALLDCVGSAVRAAPTALAGVVRPGAVFFLAVVFLSANLRAVFAALPPVLEDVRADIGLSAAAAGLLITLPLLCFGMLAPVAALLTRRMSIERLMGICAVLTGLGAAIRGLDGTTGLFGGTIVAGAAVAVAQTALPTLLRVRFPRHGGPLTGAFSMALNLGAAIGAGAAVPLQRALGGSWRAELAIFGVPAVVAGLVWLTSAMDQSTVVRSARPFNLRHLAQSWSLPAYFGLQSIALTAA